jgi:hypothetical protein
MTQNNTFNWYFNEQYKTGKNTENDKHVAA